MQISVPDSLEKIISKRFTWFCWIAVFLLASTALWVAESRAVWFDEVITLTLARLPLHNLWLALREAVDWNPPLFYLPVGILLHLLPSPELALRLPSIAASAVAGVCSYLLVKPYLTRVFAIAAAFLPLITFAALFIDEGRAYATALAFMLLAVLFWQRANSSPRAWFTFAGLACSIALAVSSHYSATLVISALLVGECAKIVLKRRIDWAAIASIFLGCVPLLVYRPMMSAIHRMMLAGFWSNPTVYAVFSDTLNSVATDRGKYFLLIFLAALLLRKRTQPEAFHAPQWPAYEVAVWLVFLLAPVEGYLQSRLSGGFTIRYALPMVFPVAFLTSWICERLSRGSSAAALALIAVATFAGIRNIRTNDRATRTDFSRALALASNLASPTERIVIGTPLLFPPFYHYASPGMRPRLLYLIGPEQALRLTGTNTPDLNIRGLSTISAFPTASYTAYLAAHQPFLLLANESDRFTWILKQLAADRVPFSKQACDGHLCAYQVR